MNKLKQADTNKRIKKIISDFLFPKFCLICQEEGEYLCQNCQAVIQVSTEHQKYSSQELSDLYSAVDYNNSFFKNIIYKFKYPPFAEEISESLTLLIIEHLRSLDKEPNFSGFVIVPVPLHKKRLKWRGFNQAEKIGEKLSEALQIPMESNILKKTKEASPQIELSRTERAINVKGCFEMEKGTDAKNKRILLVDDIFTTGATMNECARILKEAGAKKIIGIVIARD
ncbi:hypothetical protein BWK69_00315 [Candidatus Parcubacteria bacterium A4]|nr:MAG: hypothetical protein BWK69_00315 [Candidatus Parcubacteria bacterium A4]